MANIGVLLDLDIGHIFPALGVSKKFKQLGHKVYLIGASDIGEHIKEYGFNFYPVFEKVYPKGFLEAYKNMQKENKSIFLNGNSVPRPHIELILEGELSTIVKKLEIDVLVVAYSLSLEALIQYYNCPTIHFLIFTSWLRKKDSTPQKISSNVFHRLDEKTKRDILLKGDSKKVEDLITPLNSFIELIACPKEFDFERKKYPNEVFHLNSCIREKSTRSNFLETLKIKNTGRKIIYASLGSQNTLFGEKTTYFFNTLYQFMKMESSSEYFMILSVGDEVNNKKLKSIPNKIEVVEWAPQLEILKDATLVITHGGLGTIKESISFGVPMLVVPMVNDEFDNAKRVVEHGLGRSIEIKEMTPEKLDIEISEILKSRSIPQNITRMRNKFNEDDTILLNKIIRKQFLK